jgi:heat shock protein HslJ
MHHSRRPSVSKTHASIGRLVAGLLALGLLLGACSPAASPRGAPTVEDPRPAAPSPTGAGLGLSELEGSDWVLLTLKDSNPIEGSNITLRFGEGQANGFSGCNWYGGPYRAGDGKLAISEIAVTLQACQSPVGVMEQESEYLAALQKVVAYQLAGIRLEMQDVVGETILVFDKKAELAMEPGELVGTAWRLVSIDGQESPDYSNFVLGFQDATALWGRAGCRGYLGTYQARGENLRLVSLAMTGPDCPDQPALMEQEGSYTTHLELVTDYRLAESRLELLTAQGRVLAYEPLPEEATADLER